MRTQRRPDPAPEDRRRVPRKGDIRVPKAIRVKRRKTYKRFSLGNQLNLAVSSRWDRKQRTEVSQDEMGRCFWAGELQSEAAGWDREHERKSQSGGQR